MTITRKMADYAADVPTSIGSAGQVLKVNSGATAYEWADASGAFAASTVTVTANTTLTTAQNGNLIRVTASADKTISLPAAANGLFYVFSNETAYSMYIKPNGAQTINGINASIVLAAGADGIISCGTAGTNWSSVGITRTMQVAKVTTIYNELTNNGTRLTGTYTPALGTNLLVCVGSATAGSHIGNGTQYQSGGSGGQSYAEKFIASPAASYAYEICAGGAAQPIASSFDRTTTAAGMTCTRGPDTASSTNDNANIPSRSGGTSSGGDVNFTGGTSSAAILGGTNATGAGGGAATRAGNGGNASGVYGGGTGGNNATSSAVGAAATTRDSNTHAFSNSTSETYLAGTTGGGSTDLVGKMGAGPKTVVNFGSVNFTIADHANLVRGGTRGANPGGWSATGIGGYVTFVEFI